ncbi:MAG: SCPU domain-containing protein [Oxalobacteraceae bacterium]|nr:SCPU domain-containing protein [Oxalobacteraceae bacterium]
MKKLYKKIQKKLHLIEMMVLSGLMLGLSAPAIAMLCYGESVPQFVFGQYDPHHDEPHDVQTVFSIRCTPAYRGEALNLMIRLTNASNGPLRMRNLDTGEWLQFSVYKDPARSQPIDALNGLSLNFPLMAPTTLSIPVYGRIPARQDVAVGSYHWPVSITLSY